MIAAFAAEIAVIQDLEHDIREAWLGRHPQLPLIQYGDPLSDCRRSQLHDAPDVPFGGRGQNASQECESPVRGHMAILYCLAFVGGEDLISAIVRHRVQRIVEHG